jgi:glycosyltransferase involved in cell wall biosynthesis
MQVELVTHNPPGAISGIGRFVRELHRYLTPLVNVRIAPDIPPPGANRLSVLQHFPVGVQGHVPGAVLHFTQIMGCAQRLYRPLRPAVATVHDLGVLVCKEDEVLYDPIGRRVLDMQYAGLRRMDFIVADSEATRQSVVEQLRYPEAKTATVYLGLDPIYRPTPKADARSAISAKYGVDFSVREFFILYVGTELPRKNLPILLNAIRLLKSYNVSVQLIKVGDSGGARWRTLVETQIKALDLVSDVHFVGRVDENDLPLMYSAADAFVTTSLLEGFGFPVLESLACGTPVICSNVGSLPELVGNSAILIDPRNPYEVADAVKDALLNVQKWETMINKEAHALEQFRWPKTANAMMAIYEQLLGNG